MHLLLKPLTQASKFAMLKNESTYSRHLRSDIAKTLDLKDTLWKFMETHFYF